MQSDYFYQWLFGLWYPLSYTNYITGNKPYFIILFEGLRNDDIMCCSDCEATLKAV